MSARFEGKVALVAGGTGGLGRAVSLALLREGAQLVVPYRKQEEFEALKKAAGGAAARLGGYTLDVTDEVAVDQFIADTISRQRRIDVLVNSAGGFEGGAKLWDMESKVLDQMLSLNLRSGYALARAVVPVMMKQGHGSIVNIAAKAGAEPMAGAAAYSASKAAALALLNALAAEVKGTGVRVNSVLPSIIDTEANRKAMPDADFAKWPKPDEIAAVILFLCSDEAKVVHGAAVPVYGAG
jgi:NAD(P)-dependent dehydrogenase (short-subunit alcohol dehydrogenase family)